VFEECLMCSVCLNVFYVFEERLMCEECLTCLKSI